MDPSQSLTSLSCPGTTQQWTTAVQQQPPGFCSQRSQDPALPTSEPGLAPEPLGLGPTHHSFDTSSRTPGPCSKRPQDLASCNSGRKLAPEPDPVHQQVVPIPGPLQPHSLLYPGSSQHIRRLTPELRHPGLLNQLTWSPAPRTIRPALVLGHHRTPSQPCQEMTPPTSRLTLDPGTQLCQLGSQH